MSRGSVYRRGDAWSAHVKWKASDGTWHQRKVTRRTKREAEQALTELCRQVDLGTAVRPDRLTVDQSRAGWLDHLAAVVGRKPSAVESYRNALGRYVSGPLGATRLQQVTAADIDRIYR